MEEKTKKFIRKIRFDTYIYSATFIVLAISYFAVFDIRTEPIMLLLAAFAFYTVGKQVNLLSALEEGESVDTQPKTPVWFRVILYAAVLAIIAKFLFF